MTSKKLEATLDKIIDLSCLINMLHSYENRCYPSKPPQTGLYYRAIFFHCIKLREAASIYRSYLREHYFCELYKSKLTKGLP